MSYRRNDIESNTESTSFRQTTVLVLKWDIHSVLYLQPAHRAGHLLATFPALIPSLVPGGAVNESIKGVWTIMPSAIRSCQDGAVHAVGYAVKKYIMMPNQHKKSKCDFLLFQTK